MPLLALAVLCVGLSSSDAAPPDETPLGRRIARARALLDQLEYEPAAFELTLAAADPDATEAQRLEAHLWAGVAYRVLGQDTDARLHFLYVLKRYPDAQLPAELGPKVRGFFELVREDVRPQPGGTAQPALEKEPAVAPTATASAPAPEATPTPRWGLAVVGIGAGVAVLGGGALGLGAVPWLTHTQARADLAAARGRHEDAAAAADAQQRAREDWESWGGASATVGGIAVALGLAAGALGAGLWLTESP